jgi:lambda repressor-like predicted transcriptional regulator
VVKEPEKKPPKRKEIDTGKLMALRKAGWSMKNIGIELGCSEGTIFNYLKKMEENGNI